MKAYIVPILLSFLFIASTKTEAQSQYKYGKIESSELEMKIYPQDSSARAVVLYEEGFSDFVYNDNVGFTVKTEVKCRIKILKPEGAEKATISIPTYRKGRVEETVNGIEAYSYNLENGKTTKVKLEKANIFEEKVSDRLYLTKLAIPGAKEGSVIEYKYTLSSPFYYNVDGWTFQRDIPVQQSKYEVRIPEFFIFKREAKGYEHITTTEKDENQTLSFFYEGGAHIVNFTSKDYLFKVENIPALIGDNYVWQVSDFLSAVRFELAGTNIPGQYTKSYNHDWNSVEKTIKEETDFVKNTQRTVPYKDELKQIASIADEREKLAAVYGLIKSKIGWDGKYAFTDNPSDAFKTGLGNNAQINGALISALNQVGIKAFPVLIRRRSQGRLPLSVASFDKISTFIVAAQLSDTTMHFMDGSAKYGGVDMLPTDLLGDRGRTFDPSGRNNDFIDLSKSAKNQTTTVNIAHLSEDGTVKVKSASYFKMQPAYGYKANYAALKDSAEYIEKYEANNKVKVENMAITGHKDKFSPLVKEEVAYTCQASKRGNFIYVNPLLIPHFTKNDFTQSERKLPVEFSYPYTYQITTTIFIPEGYAVEELPKGARVVLENKEGGLTYSAAQQDNAILVSYRFQLNEVVFPFMSYPMLRDFFGIAATKNTEMIVLKKL